MTRHSTSNIRQSSVRVFVFYSGYKKNTTAMVVAGLENEPAETVEQTWRTSFQNRERETTDRFTVQTRANEKADFQTTKYVIKS